MWQKILAFFSRKKKPKMVTVTFNAAHADGTCGIQTAINLGTDAQYKEVYVPYVGQNWVINSPTDANKNDQFLSIPAIQLRSNLKLILAPGVVIAAKRGFPQFDGTFTPLMGGDNISNVTIVGTGAYLTMWKQDYGSGGYTVSEQRHGLRFRGCQNVVVQGLTIQNTGGDCIMVEYYRPLTTPVNCANVVLQNCICDGARRNGMSILSVAGLRAEDCTFTNTSGTSPNSGVDIEPEDLGPEIISGIQFLRCTFSNCPFRSFLVNWDQANGMADAAGILLESCIFSGGTSDGINIIHTNSAVGPQSGTVRFNNCTIRDTPYPGLGISIHRSTKIRYIFDNLRIERAAYSNDPFYIPGVAAPIEMVFTGSSDNAPDTIVFQNNCSVYETLFDRKVVQTSGISGTSRFATGTIRHTNLKGNQTSQTITELPSLVVGAYTPPLEARVNTIGSIDNTLEVRL